MATDYTRVSSSPQSFRFRVLLVPRDITYSLPLRHSYVEPAPRSQAASASQLSFNDVPPPPDPSQPFSRCTSQHGNHCSRPSYSLFRGIPPLQHDMISVTAPLTTLDYTVSIEYKAHPRQIIILKFGFFNLHCPGPTSLKPC
jgi:hypothetical protein